jgi:hypothetical protein
MEKMCKIITNVFGKKKIKLRYKISYIRLGNTGTGILLHTGFA